MNTSPRSSIEVCGRYCCYSTRNAIVQCVKLRDILARELNKSASCWLLEQGECMFSSLLETCMHRFTSNKKWPSNNLPQDWTACNWRYGKTKGKLDPKCITQALYNLRYGDITICILRSSLQIIIWVLKLLPSHLQSPSEKLVSV